MDDSGTIESADMGARTMAFSSIPVIDISLVLLVILFVTAPLLSYPTLPVDLPSRA